MASSSTQSTVFIPNELLTIIFINLHKADLKVVRLVCRNCCSLATPSLFHTIYFSPWPKDLEVFSQWTLNERCREAVKELVYDASRMHSISEERYVDRLWHVLYSRLGGMSNQKFVNLGREAAELVECLKKYPDGLTGPSEMSEFSNCQTVRQGYQAYDEQNRLHTDMRQSGEILLRLTQGLQQLTSLESIRVVDNFDWAGLDEDDDFKPTRPGPMRQNGSPFARSWHPFYLHPEELWCEAEQDLGVYESELVIRALSISSRKIERLRTCFSAVSLMSFDPTGKLAPGMSMSQHTSQVFPTIASLHLVLDVPDTMAYSLELSITGLHACLVAMRHLQDLHLFFHGDFINCLFHQVFGRPCHVWPRLSQLTLGSVKAEEHDLVEFFIKHPIRILDLRGIRLSGDSWTTVLDTLRMAEPKIQSVVFHGCVRSTSDRSIQFRDPKTGATMNDVAARYITSGGPALETIDWDDHVPFNRWSTLHP